MDVKSNAKIGLTKSREDWKRIRECFVNSFRRYPLYKYMIPDPTKRDAFLRAYLDANYDVTVGSGEGILLGVKVPENGEDKVVGGVLFVPPSRDGCGWAIGSDEPYWKAYDKHGLAKISPEGLERVKRYEAWENKHICAKLGSTRIPMWNGLFCSIDPQYACKGVGTAVYKEAIRIMSRNWTQRKTAVQKTKLVRYNSLNVLDKKSDASSAGNVREFIRSLSMKNLHCNALLHHRVTPQCHKAVSAQQPPLAAVKGSSAPLVVAISHSDRAASFHASNGFSPVLRIPYCDDDGAVVFYTHVLAMDPFQTGKIALCQESLDTKITAQKPRALRDVGLQFEVRNLETC